MRARKNEGEVVGMRIMTESLGAVHTHTPITC